MTLLEALYRRAVLKLDGLELHSMEFLEFRRTSSSTLKTL
jgi:hypothetical protein